jgi:hypothetical protein
MATTNQFEMVFERLRDILEPYGEMLHVAADDETAYGVDMAPESHRNPTTWFGGVRRGKAYVSYYFMPIYVDPALLDGISPELRKRMQGKSCFNFTKIDAPLLAELEDLTRRGYERTAGDPAWGVAKRVEHGMAYRRAMSTGTPQRRSGSQPSHGQQHASGG